MNNYIVFFQKEWTEIIRTKKLYILMGVFAFFAMISPVIARYMSEIIALATDDFLTITVPPAAWKDSWSQFYGNISQIGCICVIFMFMGCVSGEKQSGSAALTLTKNLTHTNFIVTKFAAAAVCFTFTFMAGGLICYGYTFYLFGYAGEVRDLFLGGAAYCLFIYALLGITVLSSTAARSTAAAAFLSFCGFLVLILSNLAPGIGPIAPGILLSKTVELSCGTYVAQSPGIAGAFIVTVLLTVLCVLLSVRLLKKQEL
ncbi:ABC transporter permease [Eisenbergiella sp.]